jgi:hypothetical protein
MENKKPNWFVRSLIIALGLLLILLICYSFFFTTPKGNISNGLITLLILLIIVILSEAFDNISFGKILSLNRKVVEKVKEVEELKTEKQSLLNMLVNNISLKNQVGLSGHDLKEILTVIKADPKRIEEESKEKEDLQEDKVRSKDRKRLDFRKLESVVLNEFIKTNNLSDFLFNEQVTFSKGYNSVDPISNLSPIFDGYVETSDFEIFVEVKAQRMSLYNREALYLRLSALYHYRKAKNKKAFLQLILVELPEDEENGRIRNAEEKLRSDFEPAIEYGLLKIKYIKLTKKQAEGLYRE